MIFLTHQNIIRALKTKRKDESFSTLHFSDFFSVQNFVVLVVTMLKNVWFISIYDVLSQKKKKKKKFIYDVWTSDEKDEFYGSDPKDLEANNN